MFLKDLKTYVKRTTAPYKYLQVKEFTNKLVKTISDKIKRNEIQEQELKNTTPGDNRSCFLTILCD